MVEASPDRLVAAYLRSRGYKKTEGNLREEANSNIDNLPASFEDLLRSNQEISIPDSILFYSEAEAKNINAYEDSYRQLYDWVNGSIEKFKLELRLVLFPLFLHSYLDLISKGLKEKAKIFLDHFKREFQTTYSSELRTLQTIVEPQHVKENELAQQYLKTRFSIPLSRYSFELLLSFFQENKFMLLLRILNEHVNITVTKTGPKDPSLIHGSLVGITSNEQLIDISDDKLDVPPYPLPSDLPFMEVLELRVKEDISKLESGSNELKELESLHEDITKLKEETENRIAKDKEDVNDKTSSIKLPARRLANIPETIKTLKEIRNRVKLSPQSLPSICMYTFHNTYGALNNVEFSEDGSLIAAGYSDSTIQLYNVTGNPLGVGNHQVIADETNTVSKKLIGHSGPVYSTSFSSDQKYLVSCSEDRTARLWSLDTLTNVVCYKGHNYPIWDVDFSPLGWYFATASYDGTARLWSCDHQNALRMYVGHLSDVQCIKFHPGGNLLATGSSDRTARLWDVQSGDCLRVFVKHQAPIQTLALSPDGKKLATSSTDNTVIVWDIAASKPLKEFKRHTDIVYSLAFSRDSNVLATGGADQVVRLWDISSGSGNIDENKLGEISNINNLSSTITAPGIPNASTPTNSNGLSGIGSEMRKRGLLGAYPTRKTPLLALHFTRGNILQSAGPFIPPQ